MSGRQGSKIITADLPAANFGSGRVCAGLTCVTVLSRYNSGANCSVHDTPNEIQLQLDGPVSKNTKQQRLTRLRKRQASA